MSFVKAPIAAPKQLSLDSKIDTLEVNLHLQPTARFAGQINCFLISVIALVCIPDKIPPIPERLRESHAVFV